MKDEIPLCPKGHPLDERNAYYRPDRINPKPRCRICARERTAAWRARKTQRNREMARRDAESRYPKPAEVECAWAAGLFEGEGTITISSSGRILHTRPVVTLTMTDQEPVGWLAERWGGSVRIRSMPGNAKDAHVWHLGSAIGIGRFLDHIEPFVKTARVRAKIALMREYVSHQRSGSRDPDYRAQMRVFKERMSALNQRGR